MATDCGSTKAAGRSSQSGMTLIEVVIALAILLIVSASLTGVAAVAVLSTENQGHLLARTAEYAQDKMEQLLSLSFNDTITDTINPDCVDFLTTPACSDSSLGEVGLTPGGSSDVTSPSDHYVDYLDSTGNPLGGGTTPPDGWFYMRVWDICYLQIDGTCNTATATSLKQITVATIVRSAIGGRGAAPQTTLIALKTSL